jgi:hypothetical protein
MDSQMPDMQFSFRWGRSMLQVVHNLLNDAEETLWLPGVFVDLSKALDMLKRAKLMVKLEKVIGPDHAITRILNDILAYNYVQTDNITVSRDITQTNTSFRVTLCPLLFNTATIDAAQATLQGPTKTKLYIYADDMVLVSKSKQELQEALMTSMTSPTKTILQLTKRKESAWSLGREENLHEPTSFAVTVGG